MDITPAYPRPDADRIRAAILAVFPVMEYIAPGKAVNASVLVRAIVARGISVAESMWAIYELCQQDGFEVLTTKSIAPRSNWVTLREPPAGLELAQGVLHISGGNPDWGELIFRPKHVQLVSIRRSLLGTSNTASTKTSDHPVLSENVRANTQKIFPKGIPENQDVVDLAVKLQTENDSGKSMNEIAREFTNGDRLKARSLLAQICRLRRNGRIVI